MVSLHYILLLLTLFCSVINGNIVISSAQNIESNWLYVFDTNEIVLILIGTRPDVIKLSTLIIDLQTRWRNSNVQFVVINTGQHKEMLQPMLQLFNLTIDITLDMMSIKNNNCMSTENLTAFEEIGIEESCKIDSMGVIVSKSIILLDGVLDRMVYQDPDSKLIEEDAEILNQKVGLKHYNIKPKMMIVQGDTNTALIGGLVSFYRNIPLVHVEAGLRTWNNHAPYPEEFNRRVIDILCVLCLAPTEYAMNAMLKDGSSIDAVVVVGNTVIDAVRHMLHNPLSSDPSKSNSLHSLMQLSVDYCLDIDISESVYDTETNSWSSLKNPQRTSDDAHYKSKCTKTNKYVIVSTHRRENHGRNMMEILTAIKRLSNMFNREDGQEGSNYGYNVIFLVLAHMNPSVMDILKNDESLGWWEASSKSALYDLETDVTVGLRDATNSKNIESHIVLMNPVDYDIFIRLLRGSSLIISDSGGLQEESAFLSIPCIVLRESTERMEGVKEGISHLVSSMHADDIVDVGVRVLSAQLQLEWKAEANVEPDSNRWYKADSSVNSRIYGDGYSSARISCLIASKLGVDLNTELIPPASVIGYYGANTHPSGKLDSPSKSSVSCQALAGILTDYSYEAPASTLPLLTRHIQDTRATASRANEKSNKNDVSMTTKEAIIEKRALQAMENLKLTDSTSILFKPHFSVDGHSGSSPRVANRYANNYRKRNSITVILTQYKRNTTEKQIHAILNQNIYKNQVHPKDMMDDADMSVYAHHTLPTIDRILIFQNEEHVDLSFLKHAFPSVDAQLNEDAIESNDGNVKNAYTAEKQSVLKRKLKRKQNKISADRKQVEYMDVTEDKKTEVPLDSLIHIVHSKEFNFKYHGRFALSHLLDTEYMAVFDDDTIPQSHWLDHALLTSQKYNAIVGGVGVVIGRDRQFYFNPPVDSVLEVDYVGHAWLMKTHWVNTYFWKEYQPTWEACEDIGLSASAWLHGRIRTVIPSMPDSNYKVWGDSITTHHKDGQQTYTKLIPGRIRWPVTRYWIENGYIPTLMRDAIMQDSIQSSISGRVTCRNMGTYCVVSMCFCYLSLSVLCKSFYSIGIGHL